MFRTNKTVDVNTVIEATEMLISGPLTIYWYNYYSKLWRQSSNHMSNLLVQNIKHTNGTTAQSVDNTGRITLPNTEAFYAINPSAQTISNQTWSKVNVTSTQYSRGTGWSGSDARFTAPITGLFNHIVNFHRYRCRFYNYVR